MGHDNCNGPFEAFRISEEFQDDGPNLWPQEYKTLKEALSHLTNHPLAGTLRVHDPDGRVVATNMTLKEALNHPTGTPDMIQENRIIDKLIQQGYRVQVINPYAVDFDKKYAVCECNCPSHRVLVIDSCGSAVTNHKGK
jgi:hypothetical protein